MISDTASGALFDCRSRCSIGLRASSSKQLDLRQSVDDPAFVDLTKALSCLRVPLLDLVTGLNQFRRNRCIEVGELEADIAELKT